MCLRGVARASKSVSGKGNKGSERLRETSSGGGGAIEEGRVVVCVCLAAQTCNGIQALSTGGSS